MWIAAIASAVKEHWPKIVIAVLVAVAVAFVAKCEREKVRHEETLVDKGRKTEQVNSMGRVLTDVQNAQTAVNSPSSGDTARMRDRYDRCASGGCE